MTNTDKTKFHHTTFENIPSVKRNKVLKVAAEALASAGLAGARMKDIAQLAGISYGSLYNYFPTRDDMIRTIIRQGRELQEAIFKDVQQTDLGFFAQLEDVMFRVQVLSQQHPALIAIWVELSHSYNARFADDMMALEADGIAFWRSLIAKRHNELNGKLSMESAVFLLDNTMSRLLTAGISSVQRQRMCLLFQHQHDSSHQDTLPSDIQVRASLMKMFRDIFA